MMLMLELAIAGSYWIGRFVAHALISNNILGCTPIENCATWQQCLQIDFTAINMSICLQGPRWQSDSSRGGSSSKSSQRHHRNKGRPRAYQQSFQRQRCLHSTLLVYLTDEKHTTYLLFCYIAKPLCSIYAVQRGISLWKTLWSWHHKQRKTMSMKCHDDVNSRHILGC